MRVTISDIAREAQVSKATVSRVLNGKPDVDAQTAVRIRAIVAERGYVPAASAVGLARGQARTVGMLVPSLTWWWMSAVLQGVAVALEEAGYGLLLYTLTRGNDSIEAFERQVNRNAFDALVVVLPPDLLDYVHQLYRRGLPVVLIDDRGYHPEFPSVATTNRDGSAAATRHLLERGRRHIACITGPMTYGSNHARLAGMTEVLEGGGLRLDPEAVIDGSYTEAGGHAAAMQFLARGIPLDAIVAQNDLMAAGALRALCEAGRQVAGDIAIVGFDDADVAQLTRPRLTTVRQPLREMGEAAAQLLLRQLSGQRVPAERLILPTELVVREST